MAETVSAYDVAAMFLKALGAPVTPNMQRAVAIWLRFESGGTITGNNPWNLHGGAACPQSQGYCPGNVGSHAGQIGNRYAGPGDRNVAVFATLQDGVKASAQNLIRLAPSYGYGKVISEARSGDSLGFLRALQDSSWSAGHYSYSKLVNAFTGSFNYNTKLTIRHVGGGTTGAIQTISTSPESVADALAKIVGKQPTDTLTTDDLDKLKAAYGNVKIVNDILDRYLGKTINDLSRDSHFRSFQIPAVKELEDTAAALGDIAANIGKAVGEVGDVLLFLLGITVGGIVTYYGLSMLLSAGRERTPEPHNPLVELPAGSTVHVPRQ